jgi:hypothetical protein
MLSIVQMQHKMSIGKLVVTLLGAVPGYGLAIIFIEVLGRKKLLLIRFFSVCANFVVLGAISSPGA